jgi:hypothetical protein
LRNLDNIILTPHIGKQYVRSLPENRSQPIWTGYIEYLGY